MSDIFRTVGGLIRQYGTNDPFALSEALGIGVLFCDLPVDVKGFYLSLGGRQMVFINQELEENEARVTCGHELGHAVLHRDYNSVYLRAHTQQFNGRRYELEADLFCACLLMEEPQTGDEAITLEDIARRTGLPERLVRLYFGFRGRAAQGACEEGAGQR